MPVIDLTRIVEWIKNVAVDLIKWAAFRVFIIGIVVTLVPFAIYEAWLLISEQIMSYVSTQFTGDVWTGTMVELTGMGAWIGTRLKFVECFQILSTFLVLKFALGFLRR